MARASMARAAQPQQQVSIRDRVVELRRVKAGELRANVKNWRMHPESQKGALRGMLEDVGFVGAVIARDVGGQLEIVDGHLRADVAEGAEIPVLIVDLTDDEAAKVLATYDPLSSMAVADEAALAELLKTMAFDDNAELRKMLADLQDKIIEDVAQDPATDHDVDGMALQAHEHYDYLVVLATTTHEWNVLCDRLELVPERRRGRMATCRAIRAEKLLQYLPERDARKKS